MPKTENKQQLQTTPYREKPGLLDLSASNNDADQIPMAANYVHLIDSIVSDKMYVQEFHDRRVEAIIKFVKANMTEILARTYGNISAFEETIKLPLHRSECMYGLDYTKQVINAARKAAATRLKDEGSWSFCDIGLTLRRGWFIERGSGHPIILLPFSQQTTVRLWAQITLRGKVKQEVDCFVHSDRRT